MKKIDAEELLRHVTDYLAGAVAHCTTKQQIGALVDATRIIMSCCARLELGRCGSRCICGTTPVEAGVWNARFTAM